MSLRAGVVVLLLVALGVLLGGTVLREQVAQARSLAQSVLIANAPDQAVPVREQNLDADRNIKVHEQGVVQVAPPAPITGGSGLVGLVAGDPDHVFNTPRTATALAIHVNSGVQAVRLFLGQTPILALAGPLGGGKEDTDLALTRPVRFDRVQCTGNDPGPPLGICSVSWIGAQP